MGSDDDESEDFVLIGTPLKAAFETVRKPTPIQDQTVTDERGRPQRFHGAFTGGFSAGYFNTVGSKEGWTPSTFTSSRNQRAEKKTYQPEQFMDDEDFSEHGIAERKVVATNEFQSLHELSNQQVAAARDPLAELVRPARSSVGLRLLKKLGWREGQGIGPRMARRRKHVHRHTEGTSGVKEYGCALPSKADSSDSESEYSENVTFAPRDVSCIDFRPKTNQHGLGYSGITYMQSKTVPQSASNILFSKPQPKTIRGQAFGVGDGEDEDDREIYSSSDMTAYDHELGDPEPDDDYGWTAPGRHTAAAPSSQSVFGAMEHVLEGFAKTQLTDSGTVKLFPPPQLPQSFRPYHMFAADHTPTGADVHQRVKDAKDRAAARGEQPDFKSVFELISEKDRDRLHAARSAVDKTNKLAERYSAQNTQSVAQVAAVTSVTTSAVAVRVPQAVSTSSLPSLLTTRAVTTSTLSSTYPGQLSVSTTSTLSSQQTVSSTRALTGQQVTASSGIQPMGVHSSSLAPTAAAGNIFEPFARDPLKQARYKAYLELTRTGKGDAYEEVDTHELTEWERSHERDEFQRAAALYRPLTGLMASRFTRATADDNTNMVSGKTDALADMSDQAKAAQMNMFGQLTRSTLEWHPDNVLCKRFNVPNPYPESNIVGVPSVKRDKFSVFNFLTFSDTTVEESSNVTTDVTRMERVTASISAANMLKPLSILAAGPLVSLAQPQVSAAPHLPSASPNDPQAALTEEGAGVDNGVQQTAEEERLPVDLFKAIFADDSAGESSAEEDNSVPAEAHSTSSDFLFNTRNIGMEGSSLGASGLQSTPSWSADAIKQSMEPAVLSLTPTISMLPSSVHLASAQEVEEFGPSLPPADASTYSNSGSLIGSVDTKHKKKKEKKDKKKKSKSKSKSRKHKKHKKQSSEQEISSRTGPVVVLSSSQSDDSLSNEDEQLPALPPTRMSRPTAADFL